MPFVEISANAPDPIESEVLEKWRALALQTSQVDPVCCAPDWNLAYHEVFHPGQRIFYLSLGDSLLVFSEFRDEQGRVFLTPLEDSWMFSNPILGPHGADLLFYAGTILEKEYDGLPPSLVIGGVRDPGAEALRLLLLHNRRFSFFRSRGCVQCWASLEGGLEGWLGRRSANHRAKLRKAAKKAARRGIAFERFEPQDVEAGAAIYARMLKVEEESWKGIGHCGMAEPPARDFYAALMRRYAAAQGARVIMASCDGRDVGYIFGGVCGAFYRGQQFSFAAGFGEFSLGNLMQYQTVAWLAEEGIERYYMGPISGPRMGYKEHWTENEQESVTWIMRPKNE